MNTPEILYIAGTRPEVIKVLPAVVASRKLGSNVTFMLTGQHREMAQQILSAFGVKADVDLDIMTPGATLAELSGRLIEKLSAYFVQHRPAIVVVQGDTTSAAIGGLMAFYEKIPVAHIEAGLRSFNNFHPFPEEVNRKIISTYAALSFAPTKLAYANLLNEGVVANTILLTGNTVVDAAKMIQDKLPAPLKQSKRQILVTTHRRENWNTEIAQICQALLDLVQKYSDIEVLLPVHLNPIVRDQIHKLLGEHPAIKLTPPLNYPQLQSALRDSYLVLTDSGGIQEEAPGYGVPSLVLREVTERPEAIHAGVAKLIGTDRHRIVKETSQLLDDKAAYQAMANVTNPFGDGKAGERIAKALGYYLESDLEAIAGMEPFVAL